MCPTAVHLERVALAAAWSCLLQAVARPGPVVLAAALEQSAVLVDSVVSQRREACQAQVARLDTRESRAESGGQERRQQCVGTTTCRTSSAEPSWRTRFRILGMESRGTPSRAHSHRRRGKVYHPRPSM